MSMAERRGGVGYVLKKFPVLSETFILNELLALEGRGVPIHIFSMERPNDPRIHDGVPKLKARISYLPDLLDWRRLTQHNRRAARTFGADYRRTVLYAARNGGTHLFWRALQAGYIANEARRLKLRHLHAHFASRPTSVALLASRITGIPFSFTPHATDIFKLKHDQEALAAKLGEASFVVAISEYNRRFLERNLPAAAPGRRRLAERIVPVANGIDLERFCPGPGLQDGGAPRDPFVFICVARLVEKKGLPILVDACARLKDRGVDFRCLVVGKGILRPKLERQIRDRRLGRHVLMVGPHTQSEVLARYRSSHAYVLPCIIAADGNREGLPVSIVEALACGLPVITTPVTGIPEVVQHEWNGLLAPIGDAEALSKLMERLIREPDLYLQLRANARPSVEDTFDLGRTAQELHGAFQKAARAASGQDEPWLQRPAAPREDAPGDRTDRKDAAGPGRLPVAGSVEGVA